VTKGRPNLKGVQDNRSKPGRGSRYSRGVRAPAAGTQLKEGVGASEEGDRKRRRKELKIVNK
jgi:hypothetical protein